MLPAGFVADRLGRRAIIIASGVSGTLGALALLPIDRWEWSFVSSILYWAGIAALPAMSAHVAAVTTRALLGRAMGALYGAFFVGFIVASPLAGTIAARFGMRGAILIGALLFAASTAGALGLSPGRVARAAARASFPRSFWLLLALAPLGGFISVLPTPLLPIYVREVAGIPLEAVGLYVACVSLGSAFLSLLAGRLADRFGAAPAVVANAIVLSIGCTVAALLASNADLLAVGFVLVGANAASTPVLAALLERVLPRERSALGYAAIQLAFTMGFGAGGITAGILYDSDPHLPFAGTIALALPVAVVVAAVAARVARAPAPDAALP